MADGDIEAKSVRIPVWDLPTRLFHWTLVGLIALCWWSGEEEEFDLHFWSGYAILFLISFRLLWGLFGSSTARFSNYIRGPSGIIGYLKNPSGWTRVGHSPIGALSVVALLGLIALMLATGLVQAEKEHGEWIVGPLAHLVSEDMSEAAHDLHELIFNVLLAFIGLHLAAILFYRVVLGKKLIGPMLRGSGEFDEGTQPMRAAPSWRLLACLIVALAVTAWIVDGAPPFWG